MRIKIYDTTVTGRNLFKYPVYKHSADYKLTNNIQVFMYFETDNFIPAGNSRLLIKRDKWQLDDFSHEQALLLTEKGKTFLFTGCSHSGITNIVRTVLKRTGLQKIDYVFGGFHLSDPVLKKTESNEVLDSLAAELLELGATVYYTGHCTGKKPFRYLKQIMAERLDDMPTGKKIILI